MVAAGAVPRPTVRPDEGAEPVQSRHVLLPARVGVEGQPRGAALDVEPRRPLRQGL